MKKSTACVQSNKKNQTFSFFYTPHPFRSTKEKERGRERRGERERRRERERQSYTWQEKFFEASYALRVAQKKAPSFQNQGLSSFMLYMVPLSRIFYFSFCQGNLRVQSYDIFFAISHVDFVEKYQPHHSHSVFYHS